MAKQHKAATQSPLAAYPKIADEHYQQSEITAVGKIILRGDGDDAQFTAAVKDALSLTLPVQPNTVASSEKEKLLWLGPDEWLLWTPMQLRQKRLDALQKAFAAQHAAAVDVSDYYTIIRLSGAVSDDIIAHGCPLDLRAFRRGTCAQSRFCNAAFLLSKHDETPTYDVQVRWSFADYLWNYFTELYADLKHWRTPTA